MTIKTAKINNAQIVATVDKEDNSIDIAIMINDEPMITLNVSADEEKALIRKWIGYGDSEDETIYIDDLFEEEEEDDEE
jgi:hypothetical protein